MAPEADFRDATGVGGIQLHPSLQLGQNATVEQLVPQRHARGMDQLRVLGRPFRTSSPNSGCTLSIAGCRAKASTAARRTKASASIQAIAHDLTFVAFPYGSLRQDF